MDCAVKWSPEAAEDLESIAEYIARDSEFYARAVVSKILAVSRKTSEQPLIGRVVPEIGDENIRERFLYSYRLVYRIHESNITIVAVIHGKRMFEDISDRFDWIITLGGRRAVRDSIKCLLSLDIFSDDETTADWLVKRKAGKVRKDTNG